MRAAVSWAADSEKDFQPRRRYVKRQRLPERGHMDQPLARGRVHSVPQIGCFVLLMVALVVLPHDLTPVNVGPASFLSPVSWSLSCSAIPLPC